MGADFLQLLDARTAQIIVRATPDELAALVDLRACFLGPNKPRIWHSCINDRGEAVEYEPSLTAWERFGKILESNWNLADLKDELINDLCVSEEMLHLDYWGCMAEAFEGEEPPGATTWEQFRAGLRADEKEGESGRYVLTDQNVRAIRSSLAEHRSEIEIMDEPQLNQLRYWDEFCRTHEGYRIVYQIDF